MSFETLEREACSLPPDQRRRLIAHLLAIQAMEDDPDRAERLARKTDDTDASRWLSLEDAERALGLSDGKS